MAELDDYIVCALDANHDTYMVDGHMHYINGSDAISQMVKTRLMTFSEEWFLDLDAGVPWREEIFVKGYSEARIRSILGKTIFDTEGVQAVLDVEFTVDPKTRKLAFSYKYIDVFSQEISDKVVT